MVKNWNGLGSEYKTMHQWGETYARTDYGNSHAVARLHSSMRKCNRRSGLPSSFR